MKKLVLLMMSLFVLTVTGYSQFWLGYTKSEIQSKEKIEVIDNNPALYGCYTYAEGIYGYEFNENNMCESMYYAPYEIEGVNSYVNLLNTKAVPMGDKKWRLYTNNGGIIDILMIMGSEEWFFVYIIGDL